MRRETRKFSHMHEGRRGAIGREDADADDDDNNDDDDDDDDVDDDEDVRFIPYSSSISLRSSASSWSEERPNANAP